MFFSENCLLKCEIICDNCMVLGLINKTLLFKECVLKAAFSIYSLSLSTMKQTS